MDIQEFLDNQSTDDDKVIKELLDISKNIEAKTDLTPQQIVEVCKLKHIAKKYKLTELDVFINNFMILSVSKNRLGRKEFIDAVRASRENKSMGMFGNIKDKLL